MVVTLVKHSLATRISLPSSHPCMHGQMGNPTVNGVTIINIAESPVIWPETPLVRVRPMCPPMHASSNA